jgi:hypothetical protein
MSFRRPTIRYRRRKLSPCKDSPTSTLSSSLSQAHPSASQALIPVSDAPRLKRPRFSTSIYLPGPESLVVLPGRSTLTQSANEVCGSGTISTQHSVSIPMSNQPPDHVPEVPALQYDGDPFTVADDTKLTRQVDQHRKLERQHWKWVNDIIPSLLLPHLRLLHKTDSFRLRPQPVPRLCTCGSVKSLSVTCVYFQSKCFLFTVSQTDAFL